jgi:hypothetical protein
MRGDTSSLPTMQMSWLQSPRLTLKRTIPQYICFSCHSKSINDDKAEGTHVEYHKKMKSIFGEELEATTFSALYDEVT